jgi:uncharacterized protein
MSNPFSYAELHTKDPSAAKAFYGGLFDWRIKDSVTPEGTYSEIDPGEGFPGGLLEVKDGGGSRWVPYVRVADIVSATAKAKSLGARALKEDVEVPDAGRFSVLLDPTGAPFGLWQPLR